MTTYNVKIDADTMINMLMDRVEFWVKSYEYEYSVYEGLINELIYNGLFDDERNFDPELFVDNLYINDTIFFDNLEEAIEAGYSEDNIAYLDEDSECVLMWAR